MIKTNLTDISKIKVTESTQSCKRQKRSVVLENDTSDVETWKLRFEETHPGFKKGPTIKYTVDGVPYDWNISYEWKGCYYELEKVDFDNEDYLKVLRAKWEVGDKLHTKGKQDGLAWYFWEPMNLERPIFVKDAEDDFRLSCSVDNNLSPKDAWTNETLRFKAEENLAKQLGFGGQLFAKFLRRTYTMNELILERYTIAKISPRVTTMSPIEAKTILINSGFDLSKGIYDPCGGFSGRKLACQQLGIPYESYDVNSTLIKIVGHTFRDLVAMEPVETDKLVFTSPPWKDREVWPNENPNVNQGGGGVNSENSVSKPKLYWYVLIARKVKSSVGYVLVNGADNKSQANLKRGTEGLFGQRSKSITLWTREDGEKIRELTKDCGEDNDSAMNIIADYYTNLGIDVSMDLL